MYPARRTAKPDRGRIFDALREVAKHLEPVETANGPMWPSRDLAAAVGAATSEVAIALQPHLVKPAQQSIGQKRQVRGYLVDELGPVLYGWRPPPPARPDESWREWAACAGEWDTMFPEPEELGHHMDQAKLGRARWLCYTCPVQDECLEDALKHPNAADRVGVRAGYTAGERRMIRRRRRQQEAGEDDEEEGAA